MMGAMAVPESSFNDLDHNSLRALGTWQGRYRLAVLGLCTGCPFGGDPDDCTLHEMRQLSLRERVERAAGLGEQRCEQLYFEHLVCTQRRIARAARITASAPALAPLA
jgi:hypothetical protein